jgi:uncharacterized protein (TIGR04255 family)
MAPHYAHAPILEAVLQINTSGEVTAAAVAGMHPLFAESYPTKHQVFEPFEEQTEDGATTVASKFVGYDFVDQAGKRHVAARTSGISLRQLWPYDRWETFAAEAKRVWTIYRSLNLSPIEWISLRYINRLEIPAPVTDLREYLRTLPEIAPELPHVIKSFLLRLELPATNEIDIIVLQGTVKTSKPVVEALMLDIEVRSSARTYSEDQIWERFEDLRVRKNDTFESCITEKVRELIR